MSEPGKTQEEDEEGVYCVDCKANLKLYCNNILTPQGTLLVTPFWCPGHDGPLMGVAVKVKKSPIITAKAVPGMKIQ